jgi:antitoxin MazE
MHAHILKWGNSNAVRLSKAILETAFIKENDEVEIKAEKDCITIKKVDIRRHLTIQERYENYYGKSLVEISDDLTQDEGPGEYGWGKQEGEELW